MEQFPDDDAINNLNSCYIGYYKLDKNKITTEDFCDIDGGTVTKRVGNIKDEYLEFKGFHDYYKINDSTFRFWAKPDW
jgi:hypothetical protein